MTKADGLDSCAGLSAADDILHVGNLGKITPGGLFRTFGQVDTQCLQSPALALQLTQSRAHDLTGRRIAATLDLALDELIPMPAKAHRCRHQIVSPTEKPGNGRIYKETANPYHDNRRTKALQTPACAGAVP